MKNKSPKISLKERLVKQKEKVVMKNSNKLKWN